MTSSRAASGATPSSSATGASAIAVARVLGSRGFAWVAVEGDSTSRARPAGRGAGDLR